LGSRSRSRVRRAIYAGSFDPVTNGHVDLIHRGSKLFDELVVAIGNNPVKRYLLAMDERRSLLESAIEARNVEVVTFDGLLVHAAKAHRADVILRGLRALSDFDLEFRNGLANRDLTGIETLFLLTEPGNIFVSSSLVKEIASNGGDVSRYVPPAVVPALARVLERRA
jgi:pantetheine-phosphate adenylyltransferase